MVVVTTEPFAETDSILETFYTSSEDSSSESKKNYVDEAYKNIIRSMNADRLEIKSTRTALELLSTGIRLQNMPLVKQCIEILDELLNKTNILMVYSHLSKCKMSKDGENEYEPSAPPIVEFEYQRDTDWVKELTDSLRHNCLLEIDKHAEYILKQKEMLELSYPDLLNIVERDTLQVLDEMTVYNAIYRWAIAECHRRTLNINRFNTRAVLRELCCTPRYGLLTKARFTSRTVDGLKGPTRSGILEEKEWRLIKFYINETSKKRPVQELPQKWSMARSPIEDKPNILSCRSSLPSTTNNNSPVTASNLRNTNTCEKCLIHFLSCWSAVCD